jgi:hypothetical protein
MGLDSDDDSILRDFCWKNSSGNPDERIFQMVDFHLSNNESSTLNIADVVQNCSLCNLDGHLVCPQQSSNRLRHKVAISCIYVDRGFDESREESVALWAQGASGEARYKLRISPSQAHDEPTKVLLRQLATCSSLNPYTTEFSGKPCLHMTNFALTDMTGAAQTLLLPPTNTKCYCLRGTVLLPVTSQGTGLPERLQLQTYVQSTYAVDLGDNPFAVHPEFCLQDCHGTWVRLCGASHPDYRTDYAATVRRTVADLGSYDWPLPGGEDQQDETAGPWRRLDNYRLTTVEGEPHNLEVGGLTPESEFVLWADLCSPPGSLSPPVCIRLRVIQHSIDIGRSLYDAQKGVWLQDLRCDWYKLGDPAPAYASIAHPLLSKARRLLALTDALLFQDNSAEISKYLPEQCQYQCDWTVRALHRQAHPKFCLHFVMTNKQFVLKHLAGIFDLDKSHLLVRSIRDLEGIFTTYSKWYCRCSSYICARRRRARSPA